MGLNLTIDQSILRSEEVQCFVIKHEGEEIKIKIYKSPTSNKINVRFDGPKSFVIFRFKELFNKLNGGD